MSDEIVQSFLRLVGTGRIEDVRRILAGEPAMVNAVGPHPFWGGRAQPLHVAIETKRRELFDLLLEAGADVNGSNDQYDHWSPLMLAINRKRPDTAMETPNWETDKTVTPSPHHPLGAKGVGESATVGAPPAIANAVVDALAHLGVRHIDIPITPEKVWKILKEKGVAE